MHLEAYLAIMGMLHLVEKIEKPDYILEIGSREVSGGGVRRLFDNPLHYTGIDIVDGPGVDVVADILEFDNGIRYEVIVCCEVLEHHPEPAKIVQKAYDLLLPGGWAMFTFAGPNRPVHNVNGGDTLAEGEYYRNISGEEAEQIFRQAGFGEVSVDYPKPRPPHTSFYLKFNPDQEKIVMETVADIDTYVLARKTA